jgi:serine/threonine-protein kinase
MGLLRAEAGTSIGAYEIERKLGTGGMAEVYLARRSGPRGFSKRVAIKRILPELSEDSQLIQMFCDEARVAATLSHPNIVQILEFGEHDGEFYIVMEYVEGVSCSMLLRTVAQRGDTIPIGPALYVVREVLSALAFAHAATDENGHPLNVVHRDVSPSNILVSRIGSVKLIDFGITRSRIAERRTVPGELKGKLRYMSPEQILGADVDARSDLFAAGIVLAEMLAGRALFSGKSDLEVLQRISRGELGLVRDGRMPPDLAAVLEKALAHRPDDRFQNARDFARALDDVAMARGLRLDDAIIVPYLHGLGILPSSSGTRPSAEVGPPPAVPPRFAAAQAAVTRPPPAFRGAPPPLPRAPTPPPLPGGRKIPLPPPPPRASQTSLPKVAEASTDRESPRSRFESGERRTISEPPTPLTDASHVLAAACVPTDAPPPRQPEPEKVAMPSVSAARASGTYRLRTRSGKLVGPFRRSEMLGLLATGRLSARSYVSLNPDAFVPVNTVPALSALAAHPAYAFRDDDTNSPEWLERVDAVTVPTALYRIAMQRRTGLLVAVDGKRRKRIFVDRGDPVFVASTDRDELLGQRLLSAGVVSEKILEFALASQPPFRLGEALVSFGALGAAQLVRELAKQLEDRVIDLGRWRAGELRFFPGVALDEGLHVRTREPTLHVLTRLVREKYPPGDIAALLRPLTKEPLSLGPLYRTFGPLLGLTPSEAAVLNLAEGSETVREAVSRAAEGGIGMAEALRAVFVGLCSGVLRATGWPPSPASTK